MMYILADFAPPGGWPTPVVVLGIGLLIFLVLGTLFGRGGGKKK